MKKYFILIIFLLLLKNNGFTSPDTSLSSLDRRISVIEGSEQTRQGALDNSISHLNNEFDRLKLESDSNGLKIWIAVFVVLGIVGIGLLSILKSSKNYALDLVKSKLDKELPPLMQSQIESSFGKLLRKHSQTVLNIIGGHDRIEGYKRNRRILILCEDNNDCARMEHFIKDILGFDKAEARVAESFDGTNAYDLVVIARDEADVSRYKKLSAQAIWDFLSSLPINKIALYYGPKFERLDSAVREKIQFSNIPFTTYARIIEVFEHMHLLELYDQKG